MFILITGEAIIKEFDSSAFVEYPPYISFLGITKSTIGIAWLLSILVVPDPPFSSGTPNGEIWGLLGISGWKVLFLIKK